MSTLGCAANLVRYWRKTVENLLNAFIVGLTNAAVDIRTSRLEREREARERRAPHAEEEERRLC
jgi:membrane protein CcdC involved in cytochrome C biogenesis